MANAGLESNAPLSIIVVGASGDLAMKKVLPALFALFCQNLLPARVTIMGYSRSALGDETFRNKLEAHLTCRYTPGASCAEYMRRFLARCFYVAGPYGSREGFLDLYARMRAEEGVGAANRVFYMAIPPFLFLEVAHAIAGAGLVACGEEPGWSRAVIEKPFGRDRKSSDELVAQLRHVFSEDQTFRIDHYLGKEVIQNLLVLRFANLVFEPLWNRSHVEQVHLSWAEDAGVEARGGYFEQYGIVRDVVQNHLLQMLALIAMEPPAALEADRIRDEKVRVLRSVAPLRAKDVALGQYAAGVGHAGYTSEASVARDSRTPTYAAAVLRVENPRWEGVPFLLTAGKGVAQRKTEIRIQFRRPNVGPFTRAAGALPGDELVIRVQPDEAIALQVINKAPGLEMNLVRGDLDLRYASAFREPIPDAYECLLLDVLRGDRSLFIRADELSAAWDIVTPVLHEIEAAATQPELYPFGSSGPTGAAGLAARYGIALDPASAGPQPSGSVDVPT